MSLLRGGMQRARNAWRATAPQLARRVTRRTRIRRRSRRMTFNGERCWTHLHRGSSRMFDAVAVFGTSDRLFTIVPCDEDYVTQRSFPADCGCCRTLCSAVGASALHANFAAREPRSMRRRNPCAKRIHEH